MIGLVSVMAQEAEWKHYRSSDSADAILGWYSDTLPGYGWATVEMEGVDVQGGLFFVRTGESGIALYVLTLPDVEGSNVTDIVVGRMRLSVEFEE